MAFLPFLHRVSSREDLPAADAYNAMSLILDGQATTAQIAAFLAALRTKGETPVEIAGFARAMRDHSAPISHGLNGTRLVDTCGTGGGDCATFNISTIAAFVTAGAGVRVAKHGNRSFSSICGSADLLEALGVTVQSSPEHCAAAIRDIGIGFLFAPSFHPAMKHANPARVELKMRTAFNLLGPLTNPARANAQLIGAPSAPAAKLMAHAMAELGWAEGFVVHGLDGLDEVSTTGATVVFDVRVGRVTEGAWSPADFGVPPATPEQLRGGTPAENAAIARSILNGDRGPQRDIVVVNAAAALVAANPALSLLEAAAVAAESIDSGKARRKLAELVEHR